MLRLEQENNRKKQPETIQKTQTNQSSFVSKGCFLFLFFFKTDLGEYFSEVEEFLSEHDIQFYLKSNII